MAEPTPDHFDDVILVRRTDADLYVERVGPAAAPVIYYLHGGPGYSSHSFRELMGEDLEHYQVLYADQRGGGRSYGAGSADLGVLADDVRTVLDVLEVTSTTLLAHGFGASIAVEVARRWPERVERLVLLAPWFSMPLLADDLLRAAYRLHGEGSPRGLDDPPDVEAVPADAPAGDPAAAADEAFALVNPKALFDALQFPHAAARMRLEHVDAEALLGPQEVDEPVGVWERDVREALPGIACPVVIIAGRQDGTCFPRQVEAGLERMPGALVSLLDAGHYPWLDASEAFDAVLREALAVPATHHDSPARSVETPPGT